MQPPQMPTGNDVFSTTMGTLLQQQDQASTQASNALAREATYALKDVGLINHLAASDTNFRAVYATQVQVPCASFPESIHTCATSETVSPQERASEVTQAAYRKSLLTTLLPIKIIL